MLNNFWKVYIIVSQYLRAIFEADMAIGKRIVRNNTKDVGLFEAMTAINERFGKLQDTVASAIRYAFLLAGESVDTFLKVLSFYEKSGVIESLEPWQSCR
jgi:hypothetical protein